MKRLSTLCILYALALVLCDRSFAQLTGTKTIPGDYATLADAIADLNTQGVGSGGVTFNVAAGYAETAPAGGFVITAQGTAANPIVFQKSGSGADPTFTAPAPQTAGVLNDAIFKLIGADYVTLDRFRMLENAANSVTTAASNDMTEWGVALLSADSTNGAQNNTIKNCTIQLKRIYQNTFGIYSNATHTSTSISTALGGTTPAVSHSGLTIHGNTIDSVNIGIVVVGPTAATAHNDGLDIGGSSSATGNTIIRYGTTGTFSSYLNVSGTVNGILVRNTKNFNISYNTIQSSNGGTTSGTLRGIYVPAFSTAPTGTFTSNINNNSISLRSAVAAGAMLGIAVESSTSTTTSTTNINNNDFNNTTHTVAASGTITFISLSGSATAGPLNTNINNNTFTNLTVNTTGSVTFISNSWTRPANGVINVNNNSIVTAFNKTGAGGTVFFYDNFGSSPSSVTETNSGNNFSNLTFTGATTISGWRSADGATPGSRKTVTNNTFSNIVGGSSAVTILNVSFSDNSFASNNVSGNIISNVTAAAAITGITSSAQNQNFFNNTISGLSSTGAAAVTAISITGGTTQNVYKNKIYSIEANNASGTVNGILISGGTTVSVYNNLIGDLRAPVTSSTTDAIRGINITSTTTSSNINVYYNSVYISASSSGANFSTSGIFHTTSTTATTAALDMRNNVIVNTSTPNGTGVTVAYRRSSTTLTNYASTSNNNDFYAGTPGAANLIFYDGTNSDQTIAAFKTRVSPREVASFTENPPFISTSGSSPNFLHISTSTPTQLESGGQPIGGITDDYDGDVRNASTPDVGADEFAGIGIDLSPPNIVYTPLGNTGSTGNRNLTATITDPSGIGTGAGAPRIYFRKGAGGSWNSATATTVVGDNYTFTINAAAMGGLTAGDTVFYYVAAQDNASTPNSGTNPGGGSGINPPGSTPPPSPNFYTILVAISSFPYTEDFEDTPAPNRPGKGDRLMSAGLGWSTGIVSGSANDWVRATPAKTQISVAHGGTKAYVTLATGNYNNSQNSFLQSPIFDFSSVVGNPTLSFWHNFKTESGWDGGVLEYSTDGGTVWRRVDSTLGTGGTFNTTNSTGWYNNSSASGPLVPPKWSGTSTAYTGHSSGWIQSTTTLVGFGGLSDVRFRWRFASDGSVNDEGWAIDDVTVTVPLANDAGAQSVGRYPSAGVAVGQPVIFHALIKNFGTAAQASIPVSYSVNGGAPVGPVNATGLGPGDTMTVSFTSFPFTPSAPGLYTVKVFTQLAGDGNATNDTASTFFGAQIPISSYPYIEKFTPPVVNWVTGGTFNWALAVVTGAGGASPDTAALANFFSIASGYSFLASPLFNLPSTLSANGSGGVFLSFHVAYRTYANEDDSLKIYVSTDGGMTLTGPVFAKSYASTPSLATLGPSTTSFVPGAATHWRHETVDLSAYAGMNNVVLVFWGVSDFGNNCYVDNVQVYRSNDVISQVVSGPGVVNGPQGVSVNFTSFTVPPERPGGTTGQNPSLHTLELRDVAFNSLRLENLHHAEKKGYVARRKEESSSSSPNTAGGTVYFAWHTGYPPTLSTPEFAVNTTATTPDNSIFTPNVVSDNKWWTITYSGDDYNGRATYNVSIDITGMYGISNPDRLYIVKRATSTAPWVALSTTRSGNVLTASGLQGFSDFGVGSDNTINPLPIVLGSFTARINPNGSGVLIEWMTVSEINNYGFYVQRRRDNEQQWTELPGFVPGHGTTTEPQFYSYVDNTITEIGLYHYRLRQVDLDGTSHLTPAISINITSLTSVEEIAPKVFQLLQNYPNPFNPATTIKFSVENTGYTTLELYNVLGQKVATLFSDVAEAGRYYRVKVDGTTLASGMYIYRLQSGNRTDLKKMLLLK
jgi:hypothetical protein